MKLKILLITLFIAQWSAWAKKPLVLWVNSQTDQKYYTEMVKTYKAKIDPKFNMEILSFGFTDMPNKLALAMKTGVNPPDVVQLDELHFSMYLGSKNIPFVDVTDRLGKAGMNGTIHFNRMGLFRYQDKVYGIPQSMGAVVLYYRGDLFDQYKVSAADMRTWDDFLKVGQKVKKESQALLALDWSYFEILLKQRGFDFFKPDGSPDLLNPIVVETVEFVVNMAKEGVGENPDRGNIYDPTFFTADVANGEILSVIGAGWYGLDMLAAFSPDEIKGNWKAMPLPRWSDAKSKSNRNTSTFSGQGLLIYKKSKKVEDAWKFIQWVMTDIDANVERYLQGNAFPSFVPAWADGRLTRKDSIFNNQSLGAIMVDLANDIPPHIQSPYRAKLVNLLREKYWYEMVTGSLPVKQALEQLQKEVLAP